MDFLESGLKLYLGLVGAALLLAAVRALWTRIRLLREGVRTTGVVVGWRVHHDTDGTVDGWSPRIRYTASDGSEHELTGLSGWTRSDLRPIGRSVDIVYRRDEPGRALESHPVKFWIGPPVLFALGVATLWAAFRPV